MSLITAPPYSAPVSFSDLRQAAGLSLTKAHNIRRTKAYEAWFEGAFESTPAGLMVSPDGANVFTRIVALMGQGMDAPAIVATLRGSEAQGTEGDTKGQGEGTEAHTSPHKPTNQGDTDGQNPTQEDKPQGTQSHKAGDKGTEGDTAPHTSPQAPELDHLRELVAMQTAHLSDLRRELERAGEREAFAARTLAGERQAWEKEKGTWQDREGRLMDALTREQEGMMALTKALAAGDLARLLATARDRGIPTHGLETALEAAQRPADREGDQWRGGQEAKRPWWKVWGGRAAAL